MADKVLESVRTVLINDLTLPVIKQLLDDLRKERVLNEQEVESILEENPARADKARSLVDSVRKKGSVASSIMITKIKEHDGNLYDKLRLETPAGPSTETDHVGDKEYKMSSKPRGICLIIKNVNFKDPQKNLEGYDKDAESLREVFKLLGFKVQTREDLEAENMKKLLLSYNKEDIHKNRDCFVCCVLSHGEEDGVLGSDMELCSMKHILSPFDGRNCPSLVDKPKVFFIQACRGGKMEKEIRVTAANSQLTSANLEKPYTLPQNSDFLVAMSTVQDFVSYVNDDGSWFIKSLCKHLEEGSKRGEDILTILTNVNKEVSRKEGRIEIQQKKYDAKMTPEPRFTLTRKLIFRIP
ncbi:caspase-8-like [Hoplias malabaricus]|uniref:caspase-8-like n=1 Tax=Hoplias malabaricus TaxID=27720 RepID=UPI00346345BE